MNKLRQIKGGLAFCFRRLWRELVDAKTLRGRLAVLCALPQQAVGDFAIGWFSVTAKQQVYRREWVNLGEQPPLEEILEWFRKAVYTGPSEFGFAVKAKAIKNGQIQTWGPRQFQRSEVPQVQAELRRFVEEATASQTTLRLAVLPISLLAGVLPRPLSD
jgi:hypothetical protein